MTSAGTEGPVLVRDVDAVRVVTLNRPKVRNAIDMPLRVALAEAIEAADRDPAVRVIVLTGAGGAFSSGGDISTMERLPAQLARPRAQAAQRVIRAIWATPKPVVAAVEGSAYGAGASLALACDRVVAAEDTVFSTAFAGVGLAGDMGIFASLPARVGVPRARQLLMLPAPIPAETALSLGLVDRLVPTGTALSEALGDAARLAAGPAGALGAIKAILNGPPRGPMETLEVEVDHQVRLFDSEDFATAVTAVREKRRPSFRDAPPSVQEQQS
jgi:enoyl-CoA hydratase/carnithine racemase